MTREEYEAIDFSPQIIKALRLDPEDDLHQLAAGEIERLRKETKHGWNTAIESAALVADKVGRDGFGDHIAPLIRALKRGTADMVRRAETAGIKVVKPCEHVDASEDARQPDLLPVPKAAR